MAMTTSYVVQPFEIHGKRLRPARQEPVQTESGALKKAENLARQMPGAAALKVVADDETGELVEERQRVRPHRRPLCRSGSRHSDACSERGSI